MSRHLLRDSFLHKLLGQRLQTAHDYFFDLWNEKILNLLLDWLPKVQDEAYEIPCLLQVSLKHLRGLVNASCRGPANPADWSGRTGWSGWSGCGWLVRLVKDGAPGGTGPDGPAVPVVPVVTLVRVVWLVEEVRLVPVILVVWVVRPGRSKWSGWTQWTVWTGWTDTCTHVRTSIQDKEYRCWILESTQRVELASNITEDVW